MQPPSNQQQLAQRVEALAGLTFAELAEDMSVSVPNDLRRHKGWAGQLLEKALGADAGSAARPDFTQLDIELKSLPVDSRGQPLETTYVCVAPLMNIQGQTFETSLLHHKLAHVLWLPIQGERSIPVGERMIGRGFFWQPSAQERLALKQDWEELMEMIALGQNSRITAEHGTVLQLRPKAAKGGTRVQAFDEYGQKITAQPKGFYLRKQFTANILSQQFELGHQR